MTNMKPKVSIIMPVYNTGDYLLTSMDSVIHQTLKDIEIICVNDGSTDSSLELLQRYAQNDPRIKIIDKKNGGYGHTMNRGIKHATGEYIGILEPDDFVDPEMFDKLYALAQQHSADIVKSNYYEHFSQNNKTVDRFFEVLSEFPYDTITNAFENEKIVVMRPCIWSAIYKREFLINSHIMFNETPGASYQDTAFAFKALISAKRIVFTKDAFLHYRMDNENSSVNSTGKIFSICDEFHGIENFLNESKDLKDRFSPILQLIKYDSYIWNLDRMTPEYRHIFENQMALEYLKAEYENVLDKSRFDDWRWNNLQSIMNKYRNSTFNPEELLAHSISYKIGRTITYVPRKLRAFIRHH